MISLVEHLSLGILLGALCGVSISIKHLSTKILMRSIAIFAGGLFMLTALASKFLNQATYSVEMLADLVMLGVAISLVMSLMSMNLTRIHKRNEQIRARSVRA